tara:strand:+ start:358 stop:750 length:393 start_codon:yes stop_codon:yes gene_type:complete
MLKKNSKKKKIIPSFKDNRGEITDILENEKINSITIITFKKGAIRGNHFHKKTTQWNYVLDGEIIYYSQEKNKKNKVKMVAGDLSVSYPFQKHAFKGLKKSRVLVLTKGPRAGKDYEIDTYRLKNEPLIK